MIKLIVGILKFFTLLCVLAKKVCYHSFLSVNVLPLKFCVFYTTIIGLDQTVFRNL